MKKTAFVISAFLCVAAFSGLAPAFGTEIQLPANIDVAGQDSQQPIFYQMQDGTDLQTSGESGNFQLTITRPGAKPVQIALPDEIMKINNITSTAGNQAVIFGYLGGGSLYAVVLVDALQYKIADTFWGYNPALSPDGRFIAFTKFYPRHFVSGVSDFVMLYDTTLSSSGNRPVGPHLNDLVDVGAAVYPPGVRAKDVNVGLPEAAVNKVVSYFFWAPDSSAFVFSAEHYITNSQSQAQNGKATVKTEVDLVLVDMTSAESPQASAFKVDVCARGKACVESLRSVEFGENGLKAHFKGIRNPGLKRDLQVNYDQFQSQ